MICFNSLNSEIVSQAQVVKLNLTLIEAKHQTSMRPPSSSSKQSLLQSFSFVGDSNSQAFRVHLRKEFVAKALQVFLTLNLSAQVALNTYEQRTR